MPVEHDLIPEDPRRAWVRVTTFEGSPENVRRAMSLTLEHVLPARRGQAGWQAMLGLASADGRRGLTLTFWENGPALNESDRSLAAFREWAPTAGIAVTDIDRYEVVFHETAAGAIE